MESKEEKSEFKLISTSQMNTLMILMFRHLLGQMDGGTFTISQKTLQAEADETNAVLLKANIEKDELTATLLDHETFEAYSEKLDLDASKTNLQ